MRSNGGQDQMIACLAGWQGLDLLELAVAVGQVVQAVGLQQCIHVGPANDHSCL